MRYGFRSLVRVFLATLILAVCATPVRAAVCDAAPCDCGDTITTSKTLVSGVDPVVSGEVCPDTGLFVDGSNLTLDVAGQMNGLDDGTAQTGIVVVAGSANVVITTARISGFATAVSALGVTDSNFTDLLILRTRTAGVDVSGDGNTVQRSEMKGAGAVGVQVVGDNATVFLNRVEKYASGIIVVGDGAEIHRNLVYRNGAGIRVEGTGASLALNSVKYGTGHGIELIGGGGHALDRNVSSQNAGDGFRVTPGVSGGGTGSVLTRNTGSADGGVGFRDTTTGGGTAGTGNTYRLNRCSAKVGHKSDPLGLCR
jgi:hypothetical protein